MSLCCLSIGGAWWKQEDSVQELQGPGVAAQDGSETRAGRQHCKKYLISDKTKAALAVAVELKA